MMQSNLEVIMPIQPYRSSPYYYYCYTCGCIHLIVGANVQGLIENSDLLVVRCKLKHIRSTVKVATGCAIPNDYYMHIIYMHNILAL